MEKEKVIWVVLIVFVDKTLSLLSVILFWNY